MTTTSTPITTATGTDCVCYLAKDFARARAFYESLLGLKPDVEGDNWVEYGLADGTTFALAKLPDDAWYPTGGTMFAVPDVRTSAERAAAAGIKLFGDVMDSPSCLTAWCEDSEGNNFALHQRKAGA